MTEAYSSDLSASGAVRGIRNGTTLDERCIERRGEGVPRITAAMRMPARQTLADRAQHSRE